MQILRRFGPESGGHLRFNTELVFPPARARARWSQFQRLREFKSIVDLNS